MIKIMKRVKYLAYCLCQELLGGHLLKDLPKFHMALELQVRVRGMQRSLDMMHRQPSLCSRGYDGEVRALHLDGKTSQKVARGMNLGTATPIHLQRGGVSVIFRPWRYCITVS
jgi:hypothetical protein